jgi:hypothetical protein
MGDTWYSAIEYAAEYFGDVSAPVQVSGTGSGKLLCNLLPTWYPQVRLPPEQVWELMHILISFANLSKFHLFPISYRNTCHQYVNLRWVFTQVWVECAVTSMPMARADHSQLL